MSPTSPWHAASFISPPSSTGSAAGFCPGGCRSPWRRRSASRRWRKRSLGMAGPRSSTLIKARRVDSGGRRNTSMGGVAMSTWRRRSDRSGRGALRSPGRPPVARREDRRRFWAGIGAGLSSEDAAVGAGVSPAVGTRWFREAGGMPPATLAPSSKPLSGRYLSFAEREEIAILRAQGHGVRQVARQLRRAASTISRELRRNAATRSGGLEYRATTAQWHAERAGRRPKRPSWRSTRHCGVTCRSGWPAWSSPRAGPRCPARSCPGRVAGTGAGRTDAGPEREARSRLPSACGSTFPTMRRCASATRPSTRRCTCKAGGAARAAGADPRPGHVLCRARGHDQPTPAEAADRAVPSHWEGDLILGWGSSAIGTLVERTTRFTMLLHLPPMSGHGHGVRANGPALAGYGAEAVRDAIARTITTLPEQLRQSLTWDQGTE